MLFFKHFLILIYIVLEVNCVVFRLPANSRQCLKEEILNGVFITGKYDLSNAPDQRVDLLITDTKDNVLVTRENIHKGKFAFVADDHAFEVCFISKSSADHKGQDRDVMLTIKHGTEAKSYNKISGTEEYCRLETNRPNCGLPLIGSKKQRYRKIYQGLVFMT